jgi:hypothetical protein
MKPDRRPPVDSTAPPSEQVLDLIAHIIPGQYCHGLTIGARDGDCYPVSVGAERYTLRVTVEADHAPR